MFKVFKVPELHNINNILDLSEAKLPTKLDDIDYDEFYKIENHSDRPYHSFKNVVKKNLKKEYNTFLEIGAGTGRFTVPFLRNSDIKTAVITDISKQMLTINKNKLKKEKINTKLHFATYTGTENIFKESVFDLIIGTSVLHHMENYETTLSNVFKVLRPRGKAIFLEPDLNWHKELVCFLENILLDLFKKWGTQSKDFLKLINWLYEVKFNVKYAGELDFLKTREDKHMFDKKEIQKLGRCLGFKRVKILYEGIKVENSLSTYLSQCDLSKQGIEDVLDFFKNKKKFSSFKKFNCSSMIFILKKSYWF